MATQSDIKEIPQYFDQVDLHSMSNRSMSVAPCCQSPTWPACWTLGSGCCVPPGAPVEVGLAQQPGHSLSLTLDCLELGRVGLLDAHLARRAEARKQPTTQARAAELPGRLIVGPELNLDLELELALCRHYFIIFTDLLKWPVSRQADPTPRHPSPVSKSVHAGPL